jgi:hypothetical protein
MKRNQVLGTRYIEPGHYQIVMSDLHSGECVKVLADVKKDADMNTAEFERLVGRVADVWYAAIRRNQKTEPMEEI